jgi:hypothetical protein
VPAAPQHVDIGQGLLAELPKILAGGALGALAWLWRWLRRSRAERERLAELLDATAEATRRNADALRWLLYVDGPGRGALTREQLDQTAAEKRLELAQAAARLWLALGHDERRDIRITQEMKADALPEDTIEP